MSQPVANRNYRQCIGLCENGLSILARRSNLVGDFVFGTMGQHMKVGASVPVGLGGCRLLMELKLGNLVLTMLPMEKENALAVARFCRDNHIYFIFSELLWRGTFDLCWAARRKMPRDEFYTKDELDEICRAGGDYYLGRMVVGEIGGLLYCPKTYWIDRKVGEYENLPSVETVDKAKELYVEEIRKRLQFEAEEIGGGPFLDIDAGCTFKYHLEAGIDIPVLEAMPGDFTFMTSAIRGAAKAYDRKTWGVHIAMACYGGNSLDAFWQRRLAISLYSSFMAGCDFVYPESGHFTYSQAGTEYVFDSPEMKEARRTLREFNQFSQIHSRPANGPRVAMGFVYGNLDGVPGLWNKSVWGQCQGDKWLFGPAEWGWEYLDDIYRKGRWDDENLSGDMDFYGNPPYGQYDIVPIEASLSVLNRYACLMFLGWNTMTPEIYGKLKAYVEAGGHLFMSVPHLGINTDREEDLKLYNRGDWRDLFGVVVKGKGREGIAGVKTFDDCTIPGYKMPVWRTNSDPRFIGYLSTARSELHGPRVISGCSDFYFNDEKELRENPVLTEFTVGKGKAFLLHSWTYPGDRGWSPYVSHLLRVISIGEQGEIRIVGSDRIRYAVYDTNATGELSAGLKTIYLLNTEYSTPQLVDIWVDGRVCSGIAVAPADLKVVYCTEDILFVPNDRGVEVERWERCGARNRVSVFCRKDISVRVFNLSDDERTVGTNGEIAVFSPNSDGFIEVAKRIDPERAEFYAESFLNEPEVVWPGGELPY